MNVILPVLKRRAEDDASYWGNEQGRKRERILWCLSRKEWVQLTSGDSYVFMRKTGIGPQFPEEQARTLSRLSGYYAEFPGTVAPSFSLKASSFSGYTEPSGVCSRGQLTITCILIFFLF